MSAHHTAAEPTAPPHAHHHAHPAPHAAGLDPGEACWPWTVFALMIAAQFIVILDVSVVSVALQYQPRPRLRSSPLTPVKNPAVLPVRPPGPNQNLGVPRSADHQENDMFDNTPRTFIGATTFQVTGMTCGHCQRAVTEEISRIPGIRGVTVDLATGSVTVTAAQPVDRTDVAHAVDEAGYTLIP
jgi:copper chaperone CopZ